MAIQRSHNSENDEVDEDDEDNENDSDKAPYRYDTPTVERWRGCKNGRSGNGGRFNERDDNRFMREPIQEDSDAEDCLNDLENVMFESNEENESRPSSKAINYKTESKVKTSKKLDEDWDND